MTCNQKLVKPPHGIYGAQTSEALTWRWNHLWNEVHNALKDGKELRFHLIINRANWGLPLLVFSVVAFHWLLVWRPKFCLSWRHTPTNYIITLANALCGRLSCIPLRSPITCSMVPKTLLRGILVELVSLDILASYKNLGAQLAGKKIWYMSECRSGKFFLVRFFESAKPGVKGDARKVYPSVEYNPLIYQWT